MYLETITQGVRHNGQRIVISGGEKIGKTTLACGAPNCLLIPLEVGYGAMPVPKVGMLETWDQVEGLCDEIRALAMQGKFPAKSLVWDSGTALERLIHNEVLKRDIDERINASRMANTEENRKKFSKTNTMEAAHGGYGKAYQLANFIFEAWTRRMDELAFYSNINIIVTCHVFTAKVKDPAYGEYDTTDLLLHSPKNEKNYGKREFMTQWADGIFFLHEPVVVIKAAEGQKLNQGVSQNLGRVLELDRSPAWVAGNRYGMSGGIQVPKLAGWNYLAEAIHKSSGIDLYNRELKQ